MGARKLGSIIGHRIDYNSRGSERPAAHTQQKLTPSTPPPTTPGISINLVGAKKAYATRPQNNMGNFQKKEKLPKSATKRSFSVKKNCKSKLMWPFTAFYDTDNLEIQTRFKGFTVT